MQRLSPDAGVPAWARASCWLVRSAMIQGWHATGSRWPSTTRIWATTSPMCSSNSSGGAAWWLLRDHMPPQGRRRTGPRKGSASCGQVVLGGHRSGLHVRLEKCETPPPKDRGRRQRVGGPASFAGTNRIRFRGSVAFTTLSAHRALPGGGIRLCVDGTPSVRHAPFGSTGP